MQLSAVAVEKCCVPHVLLHPPLALHSTLLLPLLCMYASVRPNSNFSNCTADLFGTVDDVVNPMIRSYEICPIKKLDLSVSGGGGCVMLNDAEQTDFLNVLAF